MKLRNEYMKEFKLGVTLQYDDPGGERITIRSQQDLNIVLQEYIQKNLTSYKLYLVPKRLGSFLKGPPTGSVSSPSDDLVPSYRENTPSNWKKGEVIGSGAFGIVYKALSASGRLFAVKEIPLQANTPSPVLSDMEREIEVMKELEHANIVRYLGTERRGNSLCILMDYMPGGSIASLLQEYGPFGEHQIRLFTQQILCGLKYLHDNNIVHRDIKGANILVDDKGLCKLADFGASKKLTPLVVQDQSSIKGTPYWMAPETVKDVVGPKSDIWSVGCTVVEMADCRPPWSDKNMSNPFSLMFCIASSSETPKLPEHMSREAHDFVAKCFVRDPDARWSAEQLLEHPFLAVSKNPSGEITEKEEQEEGLSYVDTVVKAISNDDVDVVEEKEAVESEKDESTPQESNEEVCDEENLSDTH